MVVDPEELERALAVADPNTDHDRGTQREDAARVRGAPARRATGASSCASCSRPIELRGDERGVSEVGLVRNELIADETGALRARPTGEHETSRRGS